jgi:hypothetical protein
MRVRLDKKTKRISKIKREVIIVILAIRGISCFLPRRIKLKFASMASRALFGVVSLVPLLIMGAYLITVLLVVVKITSKREGPIKIYASS